MDKVLARDEVQPRIRNTRLAAEYESLDAPSNESCIAFSASLAAPKQGGDHGATRGKVDRQGAGKSRRDRYGRAYIYDSPRLAAG